MLTRHRIIRDALVAGLIGAVCVAAWFLLVDVIAGRPFYTPAVLGSATFFGLRDASTVTVAVQPVVMYTMMHVLLFLFTGLLASASIAEAEKEPTVLWLLAEFFIVFEVGFYAVVGLLFAPLDERRGRQPHRRRLHGLLSMERAPGPPSGTQRTSRAGREMKEQRVAWRVLTLNTIAFTV